MHLTSAPIPPECCEFSTRKLVLRSEAGNPLITVVMFNFRSLVFWHHQKPMWVTVVMVLVLVLVLVQLQKSQV